MTTPIPIRTPDGTPLGHASIALPQGLPPGDLIAEIHDGGVIEYVHDPHATSAAAGDADRVRVGLGILADLEARYVLVPREGVTVRTDWGIRMPATGRVFTEPREPGPDLLERGQIKVSRTHIIGPWEARS